MLTRDQRYAGVVYEQVEAVGRHPEGIKKERYGSAAHKLPVLIRTAGLAQALHFADARGGPEYALLLTHLAAALGIQGRDGREAKDVLLEESRGRQLGSYMRLTGEALAALLWYKRFAQSILDVTAAADDEAGGGQR